MTNLEIAIANLTAAQDAYDAISLEFRTAQNALKHSKSKATKARYAAAVEASDKALEEIAKLHDAVDAAEALDTQIAADAEKAELAAMQPSLL